MIGYFEKTILAILQKDTCSNPLFTEMPPQLLCKLLAKINVLSARV